jgi:hypothetical protein
VRDRLASRDSSEVSDAELDDLLTEVLEAELAPERLASMVPPSTAPSKPYVAHDAEQSQPFSRGLLARSLIAAGLDTDRAYRIAIEVQGELLREGVDSVGNAELGRRIADHVQRLEGRDTASRYRTMRRIRRPPRPLVITLGGATGTGKSSLAVELAPLLRIYQIATDTIRCGDADGVLAGDPPGSTGPARGLSGERRDRGGGQRRRQRQARCCARSKSRRCASASGSVPWSSARCGEHERGARGRNLIPPLVPFADPGRRVPGHALPRPSTRRSIAPASYGAA